ncbi:MAG: hypothetical protein KKB70_07875 [Proteobacteria bacterium]|nr:hypothetical protein [Pseudomonadota bacterium]
MAKFRDPANKGKNQVPTDKAVDDFIKHGIRDDADSEQDPKVDEESGAKENSIESSKPEQPWENPVFKGQKLTRQFTYHMPLVTRLKIDYLIQHGEVQDITKFLNQVVDRAADKALEKL